MPLVTVAGLTRHYVGPAEVIRAVDTIDLSIEAGELLLLRGPSGAGKSTLLRLLAGLEPADSGTVLAGGRDVTAMSSDEAASLRAHDIGVVFQDNNLVPEFSAIENVMLPLELAGVTHARETAAFWLDRVGLSHRLRHYPKHLSGGEQQRVALARAFAPQPKLILADEPTGNLDAATGHQIIELMFAINAERETTLILVTHDEEIAARCHRRLRMQAGRVEEIA